MTMNNKQKPATGGQPVGGVSFSNSVLLGKPSLAYEGNNIQPLRKNADDLDSRGVLFDGEDKTLIHNMGPERPLRIVSSGLDTVIINVGICMNGYVELMRALDEENVRIGESLEWENMRWERKRGGGRYPVLYGNNQLTLYFPGRYMDHRNAVNCRVKISSEALHTIGYKGAVASVEAIFSNYRVYDYKLGEIHLYVDVAGVNVASFDTSQIVSRLKGADPQMVGNPPKTVYYPASKSGSKRPLYVCIYDKLREIAEQSGKYYMEDVYYQNGWNGEAPITRVEFRIKREILRSFKDVTVENLDDNAAALWRYCCGYVRFVDGNNKVMRKRDDAWYWREVAESWKGGGVVNRKVDDPSLPGVMENGQRRIVQKWKELQVLIGTYLSSSEKLDEFINRWISDYDEDEINKRVGENRKRLIALGLSENFYEDVEDERCPF